MTVDGRQIKPEAESPDRRERRGPRRSGGGRRRRRASAGATLAAMLLGFFFAGLLLAVPIESEVKGKPLGTTRSVQLALLKPMVLLSSFTRMDHPAKAVDGLLGRTGQSLTKPSDDLVEDEPRWPRQVTPERPLRLLVVGDSMGQVFGSSLRNLAGGEPVRTKVDYRISSGLSRPDFFDWPSHMDSLLAQFDPDATVAIFGANDGQNVAYEGRVLKVGSEEWQRVYKTRVGAAMDVLSKDGRRVYWVGNPVMRDAGYAGRIAMMNRLYEEEAAGRAGVMYVDTWKLMATGKGEFAEYLRDGDGDLILMRGADGIHITRAGGDLMARTVLDIILNDWAMVDAQ